MGTINSSQLELTSNTHQCQAQDLDMLYAALQKGLGKEPDPKIA